VEKQIIKYYRLPDLVRLFRRGLHTKKFFGDTPDDIYYLASIAVVPEARGKGISNLLMENIFKKMEGKGLKRCMLDVSITKENAIGLYRKFGFEIVEEYRNQKLERKYDLEGQYRMVYES
jgi:ribosomal protein S18 acetylase RimI-like enzyme